MNDVLLAEVQYARASTVPLGDETFCDKDVERLAHRTLSDAKVARPGSLDYFCAGGDPSRQNLLAQLRCQILLHQNLQPRTFFQQHRISTFADFTLESGGRHFRESTSWPDRHSYSLLKSGGIFFSKPAGTEVYLRLAVDAVWASAFQRRFT